MHKMERGSYELLQVMNVQVDNLLALAHTETVSRSTLISNHSHAGRLVLEATFSSIDEGEAAEPTEHVSLAIGMAKEKSLACMRMGVGSGIINYTLQDPLRLQKLINNGTKTDISVFNPAWFLEPLVTEYDATLISGLPSNARKTTSCTENALEYEMAADDTGVEFMLTDTVKELIMTDRTVVKKTKSITLNPKDYSLDVYRRVSQYDCDDEPYEALTRANYSGSSRSAIDFLIESTQPSIHSPHDGHISVTVTPKLGNIKLGDYGFLTTYDVTDTEDCRMLSAKTITFNQPHPANIPGKKDLVTFSLQRITDTLANVLTERLAA